MPVPAFLADEDFRRDIVNAALRLNPAIDLMTTQELGLSGAADYDLLAFALERGRTVVSHDVNTMTAAARSRLDEGSEIAGLILVP